MGGNSRRGGRSRWGVKVEEKKRKREGREEGLGQGAGGGGEGSWQRGGFNLDSPVYFVHKDKNKSKMREKYKRKKITYTTQELLKEKRKS